MVWTNCGVFFQRLSPAAGFAHAIELNALSQQLLSCARDGVRIQAQELGQLVVAAVSQLERFQSGVESSLLFIEHAVEQDDGGLQFLGSDLQAGGIGEGGYGLTAAAAEQLPLACCGISRGVEVQAGEALTGDLAAQHQLAQGVVHLHM